MPELPEVETIRLQLNTVLPGLTIAEINVLNPKNFGGETRQVIGKKITGIRRFGKMLVVDFANSLSLGIHLKMTGRLIYRGKKQPKNLHAVDQDILNLPNKHTRVILNFSNGDNLFFNDLRKFGWMKIFDESGIKKQESRLGIEPFTKNYTPENFRKVLTASKKAIKLVLMDQEKIAGVGNIYANDALFCARINPQTSANKLNSRDIAKLFNCVSKVLQNGLKWKGASDDAYVDAFGQKGEAQKHFLVYNRKGKACLRKCGGEIQKFQLGGRGTYFCPNCQAR